MGTGGTTCELQLRSGRERVLRVMVGQNPHLGKDPGPNMNFDLLLSSEVGISIDEDKCDTFTKIL